MRYLTLFLLTACATSPQYHWERSYAPERVAEESAQCQSQAFAVPFSGEERIAIVYATCMQGRGWQLIEE